MKSALQKYLNMIKRHRVWFLLPIVIIPLATLLMTINQDRLYKATSEVIFFPGAKEMTYAGRLYVEGHDMQLESAVALMDTDVIKDKILAAYRAQVWTRHKVKWPANEPMPFMPTYVPNKKYNTISIVVEDRDAAIAKFMSNLVANLMVSEYIQLNESNPESASEMIDARIAETQKKLDVLDEAIKEYKESNNISDMVGKKASVQNQLERLQASRSQVKGVIEELRTKISAILADLNIGSADEAILLGQLSQNREIQALQTSLIEAKVSLEEMNSKYGDSHPRLQQIKYLVSELEGKLSQEIQNYLAQNGNAFAKKMSNAKIFLNPSQLRMIDDLMAAETELKAKQANFEQVESEIASLEQEVAALPEEEYELVRLQREHDTTEKSLAFLQEQLESMDLTRNGSSLKVQVSKRAHVSEPKNPFSQLLFAFLCAPIIGALLAMGWEMLDERIYTKSDLEQLIQLPVIQEIPLDKTLMLVSKNARRDFIDVFGDNEGKVALVPEIAGVSIKQELFQLKSRLSALQAKGQKVFTILSPESGSGTTFLVTNLAILFAESQLKTLVIDGNLRVPEIHGIFNLGNEKGFTDLLQEKANIKEVLHRIDKYGSLFVLPAGTGEHDPLYYLEHPKIEALMESLKKHFDIIIFNAPSDMNLMDAPVLANLSQKVILNIRQEDATISRLRTWQKQLELVNREKLGLVVNFKTT